MFNLWIVFSHLRVIALTVFVTTPCPEKKVPLILILIKCWASDFLLWFVCFIDTGFRKCDRDKHVPSANIGVKCVTFVSETFTRYGSNITNVWQEIVTPVTLAFSHEVVHEKLWKSVNICKSYSKKISGTFLWTRCMFVYWLPRVYFFTFSLS